MSRKAGKTTGGLLVPGSNFPCCWIMMDDIEGKAPSNGNSIRISYGPHCQEGNIDLFSEKTAGHPRCDSLLFDGYRYRRMTRRKNSSGPFVLHWVETRTPLVPWRKKGDGGTSRPAMVRGPDQRLLGCRPLLILHFWPFSNSQRLHLCDVLFFFLFLSLFFFLFFLVILKDHWSCRQKSLL